MRVEGQRLAEVEVGEVGELVGACRLVRRGAARARLDRYCPRVEAGAARAVVDVKAITRIGRRARDVYVPVPVCEYILCA